MNGNKRKTTKNKKIPVQWEEQEDIPKKNGLRPTPEEDAKLFHEAVRFGKIPRKDLELEESRGIKSHTKKKTDRYDIDLHGMTVDEAQRYVVNAIEEILASSKGQPVTIRVITGKGHGSRDRGPQLIHSIHHVVESRFKSRLISIEVSPHELKIGNSYLKGHFDLKIR